MIWIIQLNKWCLECLILSSSSCHLLYLGLVTILHKIVIIAFWSSSYRYSTSWYVPMDSFGESVWNHSFVISNLDWRCLCKSILKHTIWSSSKIIPISFIAYIRCRGMVGRIPAFQSFVAQGLVRFPAGSGISVSILRLVVVSSVLSCVVSDGGPDIVLTTDSGRPVLWVSV